MEETQGPLPGFPDRRDRMGDRWRRIGMIAPSSNTVLEPETMRMVASLGDAVSVHFGRVGVSRISTSGQSSSQFAVENLVSAAKLLAGTRPDVMIWNGTAASWLGIDRDEIVAQRMAEATATPSTTTMLLYREAFAALGVRRLALVTPYPPEVQVNVVRNIGALGIEIVVERHLGDAGNFSYAEYSDDFVANELRLAIDAGGVDAAAVMCTNYRGARAAVRIEAETGVPVLDSVALTLWGALVVAGVDTGTLSEQGQIFSTLPKEAASKATFWAGSKAVR